MSEWVSPNTITGAPAEGEYYLDRVEIRKEFWRKVKAGEHIRFLAPRRVGKTSIMKYIAANPLAGYICLYENIQSVRDLPGLTQRIFEMILKCANQKDRTKTWIAQVVKKFSIKEITATGVKFDTKEPDFTKELFTLLDSMAEIEDHVILFLDEFPEIINKLRKANKTQEAIEILHLLRELRQTKRFKNFTMVIAGSIGLEYVVKKIDRVKNINDLKAVVVGELERTEARALIKQVTKGATLQYSDAIIDMLLSKVAYQLPYYIQQMVNNIDMIAKKKALYKIDQQLVEDAFENIIRFDPNLDDWYVRLTETYDTELKFINETLIACAKEGKLAIQQIANIAQKYNLDDEYVSLMNELCNDGYLVEDKNNIYCFVSPFLQAYWKRKFRII